MPAVLVNATISNFRIDNSSPLVISRSRPIGAALKMLLAIPQTSRSLRSSKNSEKNSGTLAVFRFGQSSAVQDFRGERNLTGCKFAAKNSKNSERTCHSRLPRATP
jgi:hypothetical protein